jgi:PAS domain S-box-containing protein
MEAHHVTTQTPSWISSQLRASDERMGSSSSHFPGSVSFEDAPRQRPISLAVLLIPLWIAGLLLNTLQIVDGALVFVSPGTLALLAQGVIGLAITLIAIHAVRAEIHERRKKHRLLTERNQLRALIDSLPDFIYIKDTESRFLIANRPLATYLGTTGPEALIGHTDFEFLPDDAPRLRADEQRVIATGQAIINQEEPLSLASQPGVILTSKVPLRNTHGEIVGLVGIGRDVTEHRKTLSTLQSIQELSSAMLRALPIYLFETDPQANILRFQTAVDSITLPLPDPVPGHNLGDFLPPLATKGIQGIMARTAQTGSHDTIVFPLKTSEDERWLEVWIAPSSEAGSDSARFIILIHDITSRRRIETQLEETLAAELEQRLLAETISELTLALTSTMSLGAVMVEILQQARRLVAHNVATIGLVEGGQLRSVHHQADPDAPPLTFNNVEAYPVEEIPIESEIVRSGEPYLIADAREEPQWHWYEGWEWLRAYLGMPIKLGGEVIGLLCLASGEIGHFTDEHIERLKPFVSAAAIALENAQLYAKAREEIAEREQAERALRRAYDSLETKVQERTFALATANSVLQAEVAEREQAEQQLQELLEAYQHRNRQLQTVTQVSKSASASLDEHSLGSQLADLIRDSFNFYFVGLFLADDVSHDAVLYAGTGEAGQQMLRAGHALPIGGPSMVGQCIAQATVQITLDAKRAANRYDNPLLPRTRSELVMPLISGETCFGALTIHSTELDAFSEEDATVLQSLADHLAIAIANARLFEAAEQEIARRRLVEAEITQLNESLERRVAERTEALAAANRELETFSYSVSHDLRAPLRSIQGFSQALLEDHGHLLDEEGLDYLHRVRAASQRMSQLIGDLLDLSRVTRVELQCERVDLSQLAEEITANLQAAHPERRVTFHITPDLVTHGDPHLLRIALENLLSNAWKFTGKHPKAHIEFGAQVAPDGARTYFVRDDGVGFDMAYAAKLFAPFQRLHAVSEFEGTGVGLATVQRILRRHGGKIWAEGALDQGATFYFTL